MTHINSFFSSWKVYALITLMLFLSLSLQAHSLWLQIHTALISTELGIPVDASMISGDILLMLTNAFAMAMSAFIAGTRFHVGKLKRGQKILDSFEDDPYKFITTEQE